MKSKFETDLTLENITNQKLMEPIQLKFHFIGVLLWKDGRNTDQEFLFKTPYGYMTASDFNLFYSGSWLFPIDNGVYTANASEAFIFNRLIKFPKIIKTSEGEKSL